MLRVELVRARRELAPLRAQLVEASAARATLVAELAQARNNGAAAPQVECIRFFHYVSHGYMGI